MRKRNITKHMTFWKPPENMILRSKGIVDGGADGWLEFDYVPGEWEVRQRGADVGGKLVVIGSKLDEKAIAALFGC